MTDLAIATSVVRLPLDQIKPDPSQPRRTFEKEALAELGASLREHQIQPIVVRPVNGSYMIVAGERRYRAAQLLKLEALDAIVREHSAADVARDQLAENLQRADLLPLEEAAAMQRWLKAEAGRTIEQLAQLLGKSPGYVSVVSRLALLPKKARDLLAKGAISRKHGRELLRLIEEPKRLELVLDDYAYNWNTVDELKGDVDATLAEAAREQKEKERQQLEKQRMEAHTAAIKAEQKKYATAVAAAKKAGKKPPAPPKALQPAKPVVTAAPRRDAYQLKQDKLRAAAAKLSRMVNIVADEQLPVLVKAVLARRKLVTSWTPATVYLVGDTLQLYSSQGYTRPGGMLRGRARLREIAERILPKLPGQWKGYRPGTMPRPSYAKDVEALRSWIALILWANLDEKKVEAQLERAAKARLAKEKKGGKR